MLDRGVSRLESTLWHRPRCSPSREGKISSTTEHLKTPPTTLCITQISKFAFFWKGGLTAYHHTVSSSFQNSVSQTVTANRSQHIQSRWTEEWDQRITRLGEVSKWFGGQCRPRQPAKSVFLAGNCKIRMFGTRSQAALKQTQKIT